MSARAAGARRGLPTSSRVSAPADRRFRRSDARPSRRKRIGQIVVRALRVGVPAVVVVLAGVAFANLALNSEYLRVSRIVIQGNTRLSVGEIESLLSGVRGRNILHVDFEANRRQLLDSPWVADVQLARVLPRTLQVTITERLPMAVARLGQQLYLIDESGVIIDEFGPNYQEFDLPIVDGLVSTPAKGGATVDPAKVALTSRFLSSIGSEPELRRKLSQVDVSNRRDVAAMLDGDTVWLHLGDADFVARLRSYLDMAPALREQVPDLDYVDLRFDGKVFGRSRARGGDARQ
ncbi:MAG TPA: FtsQ-type POTRA domain-containing protein [Vicinamibacterales bacterium]|nr:FtsQ-type POTRA domain-containing protein [Vicinamibacterales bacterium]